MSNKIDNLKGKRHNFTPEERAKGGRKRTDNKIYNCRTNAIKNKNENTLKDCNSCNIPFCPEGEDNKECTLFNTKFVRLIMFKKNLSTVEDFDNYMFDFFRRGSMTQEKSSFAENLAFMEEFLELMEYKRESIR